MDYFHQLLESYAKLKKRKLKLRITEAVNPEAEILAQQAKASASTSNPSYRKPFIANGARTQFPIFINQKGDLVFSPGMTKDGFPITGRGFPKSVEGEWNLFVGYFDNQEAGGTGTPEASMDQNQQQPMQPQMEMVNPLSLVEEVAPSLETSYSNIPSDLLNKSLIRDFQTFVDSIIGSNGQSVESHFINAKKIQRDEVGIITRYTSPADPNLIKIVRGRIVDLVSILSRSGESLNEDDRQYVEDFLILNTDGSVTISLDGTPGTGLNFQDSTGVFKLMAETFKTKFDVEALMFDLDAATSFGSDNHFRGVNMEEIVPLIQLIARCEKESKIQNKDLLNKNKICKAASQISENFKGKLAKMREVHADWIMARGTGAIDAEDLETYSFYAKMFGDENKSLFKALTEVSKKTVQERGSDYTIPIGGVTGCGRRADLCEVWTDAGTAIKNLRKMGLSEDRIQKMVRIAETDILAKSNRKFANFGLRSGLLKSKSKLTYINTSLKNHINLNAGSTLGYASREAFSEALVGNHSNNKNAEALREFVAKMRTDLNISDQEFEGLKLYDNEINDIRKRIEDIPAKARVKIGSKDSGKNIQSNVFKELLDSVYSNITSKFGYEDLKNRGEVASIKKLIDAYQKIEGNDNDDSIDYLGKELRHRLSLLASRVKLNKDISNNDPIAKKYFAAKVYHAGASVDDGLLVEARGLTTGENYSFLHNEAILPVLKDFITGGNEWSIKIKMNTIDSVKLPLSYSFINNKDRNLRVSVGINSDTIKSQIIPSETFTTKNGKVAKKRKDVEYMDESQHKYYNEYFNIRINKAYMEYLDSIKGKININNSIIDDLLLNQRQIFETLIAQIKR